MLLWNLFIIYSFEFFCAKYSFLIAIALSISFLGVLSDFLQKACVVTINVPFSVSQKDRILYQIPP